uniref:Uncharacterized protein n=1 Tax=Siphoviridae sp. ctfYP22 TaxID=2827584 RepID=A0A8S5LIU6_9CAUD|nr:MAG TPA: hypothetical protein [Siphoviridae sp. ctfYP22]
MKTNKTITLLGKELTISQTYDSRGYGLTETIESIHIDLKELTSLITSEEDAEQIAEEMSEYAYNEAYNECKAQAEEGEALYAYRTLMIYMEGTGRYNSGYLSASAMYIECESSSECCFTFGGQDIDRKEEENEEGEEIADNIRYNKILDALKRQEFSQRMSEGERGDFERLEEEARENYRRLHPEEFDEED